jgi:hypothetical protein
MAAVEPGEKYRLTYGDGRTLEATTLGFRKQRALIAVLSEIKDPAKSQIEKIDAIERAIKLCLPDLADDWFDTVTIETASEVMGKLASNGQLSEEDRKKSDSQP